MVEAIAISTLLGLSLGSFVNSLVYRLPRGISIVHPRSSCPSCNGVLQWREIIPVVSYVFLGGRCSQCNSKIPLQYPAVEITCGAIAAIAVLKWGLTPDALLASMFVLMLLTVAVIDWLHLIIPNQVVYWGLAFGLAFEILFQRMLLANSLSSSLAVFAIMTIIRFAGNRLFRKEAMGFGDVKLSALIAFFIGVEGFFVTLWIAALVGAMYGIGKSKDAKIPFGSFLAASSAVVFFFRDVIYQLVQEWLTFNQ